MTSNNHGHHEHNEHHHGHGHGHGNGDGDTDTLPTPISFVLQPFSQAIITVAFYGPLQKQIIIKEQSGIDYRVYTSCVDGRRPYIVLSNTAPSTMLYYSITPSMYENTCVQPVGPPIDLILKGTFTGSSVPLQTNFIYGVYSPATSYFPGDKIGVTIVIQTEIGDLLP
jgi:hypothetical protein